MVENYGNSIEFCRRYIYAYCNEMNACIDKYSNDNEAIKKTAKDLYIRMYNDGFLHKNKTRLAGMLLSRFFLL